MAEEKEEPIVDNTSEGLKVKKKRGRPKKLVKPDEVIKVDLTKKEDNAVQEQGSNDSNATIKQPENEVNSEKVVDEVRESSANEASEQNQNEKQEEIASPLVEITDEEVKEPVEEETVIEQTIETTQQRELPENIEKLISFMEETGGTVEDYARLNADYSQVEEDVLLREYYKTTKPHLNSEEINFMLIVFF